MEIYHHFFSRRMVNSNNFSIEINVRSSIYEILNETFRFHKDKILIIIVIMNIKLSILFQFKSSPSTIETEFWNSFVETGRFVTFTFYAEAVDLCWLMLNLLGEESIIWRDDFICFT